MAESIVIEIPSSYKYLNLVDLVCGDIVSDMGFASEAANEISISVIEACTNALEHGNRCCPQENVRVIITERPDHNGFDILCLADCTDLVPVVRRYGEDHAFLGLTDPDLVVAQTGVFEWNTLKIDRSPELAAHFADRTA